METLNYSPLNPNSLSFRDEEYFSMLLYMWREFELGFKSRWMITIHYKNPDDKVRSNNEVVSSAEVPYIKDSPHSFNRITKYQSMTRSSNDLESNYDSYMRKRYSDLDWIYRDTNAVNRRINKHLFGVDHLNSDIYNRPKSKFKRPYLYYFHERGKYGKYRKDKEYHTHLVLPDIPNIDQFDLEFYFNFNSKFRSLKCISNSRNIHIEEKNSEEAFGYLTKESSRFNIALDPFNSFTIQRNNDSNSNKRASS